MTPISAATRLRASLGQNTPTPLITPVVYDALSAKLVERAGFGAAWLGGSGVSNAMLGVPDAGYIQLSDMDYALRNIADAVSIPILADLDNGYGSVPNVIRSIQAVERSGAAGAQIDDQLGHKTPYGGLAEVVDAAEVVAKIKAAVDARRDPRFLIVARTDALWSEGLSGAIDRANAYARAGAEVAFITGVARLPDMVTVARDVTVRHRMLSIVPPGVPLEEIKALGFDMVALGQNNLMRASVLAMWTYLEQLRAQGAHASEAFNESAKGTLVEDWAEFTGLNAVAAVERTYDAHHRTP